MPGRRSTASRAPASGPSCAAPRSNPLATPRGVALLDLLFVVSLIVVLASWALPHFGSARDRFRNESAARMLATTFRAARFEAARRGVAVGVRARAAGGSFTFAVHADGNGNGVRLADINDGSDPPVRAELRLHDDFPGVTVAIRQPLPAIEGSGTLGPGSDPARLGASDVASFSPEGTASGGTVYLAGADGSAYAVRILGATGRTRVLRFNRISRSWDTP